MQFITDPPDVGGREWRDILVLTIALEARQRSTDAQCSASIRCKK